MARIEARSAMPGKLFSESGCLDAGLHACLDEPRLLQKLFEFPIECGFVDLSGAEGIKKFAGTMNRGHDFLASGHLWNGILL